MNRAQAIEAMRKAILKARAPGQDKKAWAGVAAEDALTALTPLLQGAVEALALIQSDAELHMMGLTSNAASIQRRASTAHANMKELLAGPESKEASEGSANT